MGEALGSNFSTSPAEGGGLCQLRAESRGLWWGRTAVLGTPAGIEPVWQVSWQLLVLAVFSSSFQSKACLSPWIPLFWGIFLGFLRP